MAYFRMERKPKMPDEPLHYLRYMERGDRRDVEIVPVKKPDGTQVYNIPDTPSNRERVEVEHRPNPRVTIIYPEDQAKAPKKAPKPPEDNGDDEGDDEAGDQAEKARLLAAAVERGISISPRAKLETVRRRLELEAPELLQG